MTSSSRVLRNPQLSSHPMQLGDSGRPTSQVLRMIEEASQAAYEQGVAAGRAAAEETFEARLPRLRAELATTIDEHLDHLRRRIVELAPDVLEVALQIAEVIIERSPADTETLAARVQETLAKTDDDTAVLKVSERDFEFFSTMMPPDRQVVVDPSLAPGEARLDGRWVNADLTYAALLEAVRRTYET